MKRCFDCGTEVPANKLYCCHACRTAFHNHMSKRGRVIMPMALGWRIKRGTGPDAKFAFGELTAYLDHCNAEDRAAGRPPMNEYIERVRANTMFSARGWREAGATRQAGIPVPVAAQ